MSIDEIIEGMTEAQRDYLLACPTDKSHWTCQVGYRNWGHVPSALTRRGLFASLKRRPWDSNCVSEYQITELGKQVRARLEEQSND